MFYNVATVLHFATTRGLIWKENYREDDEYVEGDRGEGDFGTLIHFGKQLFHDQVKKECMKTNTSADIKPANICM